MVKILWVNHEFEGPVSGCAEYEGDRIWFSRLNAPSFISSTSIPVPPSEECSEKLYSLHKIDEDSLKTLEDNHRRMCEKTGNPFFHGEPKIISRERSPFMPKIHLGKFNSLVEPRTMTHNLPKKCISEFLKIIRESEFENFNVQRKIVIE